MAHRHNMGSRLEFPSHPHASWHCEPSPCQVPRKSPSRLGPGFATRRSPATGPWRNCSPPRDPHHGQQRIGTHPRKATPIPDDAATMRHLPARGCHCRQTRMQPGGDNLNYRPSGKPPCGAGDKQKPMASGGHVGDAVANAWAVTMAYTAALMLSLE